MKSHLALASIHTTESASQTSVKKLSHLLADTYLLYLKTQNFHWNVEDARFAMLHAFFEDQYKELAEATDLIAERIRMLGHHAPSTLAEFAKSSGLSEGKTPKNGNGMLKALLEDHARVIIELKKDIKALERSNDQGTVDMMIERLRAHEKMAWMLRSHL
jgi:starvation-inducible DNA-binding protein